MRTKLLTLSLTSLVAVAGCGGGSSGSGPNAYQLAQQACNTNGATAADLARQAAAIDPKYDRLAADEAALAGNIQAQQSPDTSGDGLGDLAGVTGQEGTGTGSSYQVLLDCKSLAMQVLPGQ